jgi:hypothetical protein
MDGACAQAFAGSPRNRLAQGPVHFEHAGTVAVSLQLAPERGRKVVSADGQQLPRSHVQEGHVPAVPERLHGRVGGNRSAGVLKARHERIGNRLCPALRDGPANSVGGQP